MPSFLDFLPDDNELKRIIIDNNLKIGSVLRFHLTTTTPPKIKRFIITGFSRDKISVATVFINSEINPNVFPTSYLQSLHIELEAEGREYLDHNSFVNCSDVKEEKYEDLKTALENNPYCNIGTVSDEDLKNIKDKLAVARTLPDIIKNKYGFKLQIKYPPKKL